MAASTATYIGLRTWRYAPPTTRRSGAATGAGVPWPSTTKRTNAWTSAISPATSTTPPSTRAGAQYGRGSRTCQRVSAHGTRPTTTPGANKKNSALPTAAVDLRIVTSHLPVTSIPEWAAFVPAQVRCRRDGHVHRDSAAYKAVPLSHLT